MIRERNLRIVLFTVTPSLTPTMEEWLSARGHRLVGVVSAPGPRVRRTDDYLESSQYARPGLDVVVSNYPNHWADMIRPMRPDLVICASFNWKIPADVLAVPRLGAINAHDALLPRYRGRNATGWALRNGETEYGVTFHYMTPEFDDGPILAQDRIPITDEDDIDTLHPRFFTTAARLFQEALGRVETHHPGIPQDESAATLAGGAFEPEWRIVDWNRPARDVFVQIRSWYGARDVPRGAFGTLAGRQALITKARLSVARSGEAIPGTIVERRDDGALLVQCGDGPLEVVNWAEAPEEYADWMATIREPLEAS